MTQNKTMPTEQPVDGFLQAIADTQRRLDCLRLRQLMESASGQPAVLWGSSIVGFGNLHYRYASGREGDTPAVAFSPRASSITLYISGGFDTLGPILERLGKYRLGKGCLYIRHLDDIDEAALIDLIDASLDRAAELNVLS
jgi:hypothetical protein